MYGPDLSGLPVVFALAGVGVLCPFADKDSCEASKTQITRVSKKIEHGCVSFISPKPAQ
ncbi:hypothetical protein BjapCC829_21785 [Bradyrhizobium barranii]|uniref:Uncharacterized protein n=1 Tax=Bradyrhizobium barranii TaxID=2992140 RepID=A0ABY3QYC7_9BRAD|nr:hypothetical protein [Bradyrhizobium japonicum]UFW91024.1 hypothetical protein BjapCC829_21785 [Bradyrhizobium japonicum]